MATVILATAAATITRTSVANKVALINETH